MVAFDKGDHEILTSRLGRRVGIEDEALTRFRSYMVTLCPPLSCGAPQGSVSGPLLSSFAPAWFHIREAAVSFTVTQTMVGSTWTCRAVTRVSGQL